MGASHEQSHDNHVSTRTVIKEFAKFAVKEVIFSSKLGQLVNIGYRIASKKNVEPLS